MIHHNRMSPGVRSQVALSLSILIASLPVCQTIALASVPGYQQTAAQRERLAPDTQMGSATATASKRGVLLQWRTSFELDNVGFNIYRERAGERTRVNREIILGSTFIVGQNVPLRAGYSYSWFDSAGTVDSLYTIESVGLDGTTKSFAKISPQWQEKLANETLLVDSNRVAAPAPSAGQQEYPSAGGQQITSEGALEDQWLIASQTGLKISIKRDGWYRVTKEQMASVGYTPTVDIANLRLFKGGRELAIRTNRLNGQFGAGDFIEFYGQGIDTPTTDTNIYYLVAGSTAGKRIASIGKRVSGTVRSEGQPIGSGSASAPAQTLLPPLELNPTKWFWWVNPPSTESHSRVETASPTTERPTPTAAPRIERVAEPPVETEQPLVSPPRVIEVTERATPGETLAAKPKSVETNVKPTAAALNPGAGQQKKEKTLRRKKKRNSQTKHAHPVMAAPFVANAQNFDYTVEKKDRTVYFASLINGETENYFGAVISSSPVDQLLATPHPDSNSTGAAHLQIALQGASLANHIVNVQFNGVAIGSLSFFGVQGEEAHPVRTFDVPVSQIRALQARSIADGVTNGTNLFSSETAMFTNDDVGNQITLVGANLNTTTKIDDFISSTTVRLHNAPGPAQTGVFATITTVNNITLTAEPNSGLSIVDYIRLTYPHSFVADNGSLRFSLGPTDSASIDGFNTSAIKLIDYTDPFNVRLSTPRTTLNGSAYRFDVPAAIGPDRIRTLLAIPEANADAPLALSLNQPSILNLASNAADLLIISHASLIPTLDPLVRLRRSQEMQVSVVDVEDVYDEFGFGTHGPQPIKDFLAWASSHWSRAPRYVIFAGDASSDPRNYLNVTGNVDLVPTKLVDATYSETSSDDWLTDFNNDGSGDIPVGRLPVRTVAEANIVVSKIVNFAPSNTPQSALLVADTQGSYYFNFEQANSQVQALLPATMTVQRVDRRLEPSDTAARNNILANFNSGQALVNYSGHGNVDTWTGGAIFTSSLATGLTNGNKLPFVVVMDCLNGYFQDPSIEGIAEALMKAPNGGAVAAFASSGSTIPDGQHAMSTQLYTSLYGSQPIALGDAIKIAKAATFDIDVRRTWIFFGDPSMKIR